MQHALPPEPSKAHPSSPQFFGGIWSPLEFPEAFWRPQEGQLPTVSTPCFLMFSFFGIPVGR
eukprot:7706406-Alexandrium_andersonii.AAC.1